MIVLQAQRLAVDLVQDWKLDIAGCEDTLHVLNAWVPFHVFVLERLKVLPYVTLFETFGILQ